MATTLSSALHKYLILGDQNGLNEILAEAKKRKIPQDKIEQWISMVQNGDMPAGANVEDWMDQLLGAVGIELGKFQGERIPGQTELPGVEEQRTDTEQAQAAQRLANTISGQIGGGAKLAPLLTANLPVGERLTPPGQKQPGVGGLGGTADWQEDDWVRAYMNAYGIPAMGGTRKQDWLMSQAPVSQALFGVQQQFGDLGEDPDYAAWLPQAGTGRKLRGNVRGAFDRLTGLTPETWQSTFGTSAQFGDYGLGSGSPFGSEEEEDAFLRSVLRSRYSSPIAQRRAGLIPKLRNQFVMDSPEGTQEQWLDFAKSRLGF